MVSASRFIVPYGTPGASSWTPLSPEETKERNQNSKIFNLILFFKQKTVKNSNFKSDRNMTKKLERCTIPV